MLDLDRSLETAAANLEKKRCNLLPASMCHHTFQSKDNVI